MGKQALAKLRAEYRRQQRKKAFLDYTGAIVFYIVVGTLVLSVCTLWRILT